MLPEQPKSLNRFGLISLVLLVLVILSSKVFPAAGIPVRQFIKLPEFVSTFNFVFQSSSLQRIVSRNLAGKKGDFSVVIEDLTEDDKYGFNASEIFPAASLYKLYLLAAVLRDVEDGRLKMEDRVTATRSHLVDVFGSVDFGYEEAPETISYTVDEALTRVGRISDNFASLMLAEKVGWDKIREVPYDLGATSTRIQDPILTTASDIAAFFRKLYKNEVYSPSVSEGVIKYLSLNQLSNRIPAGVLAARSEPEGVKIVHKTGELSRIRHDGGIVYLEGRPYLIIMLSKDLQYEDEGIETLATISKDVYEYFSSKKNE